MYDSGGIQMHADGVSAVVDGGWRVFVGGGGGGVGGKVFVGGRSEWCWSLYSLHGAIIYKIIQISWGNVLQHYDILSM